MWFQHLEILGGASPNKFGGCQSRDIFRGVPVKKNTLSVHCSSTLAPFNTWRWNDQLNTQPSRYLSYALHYSRPTEVYQQQAQFNSALYMLLEKHICNIWNTKYEIRRSATRTRQLSSVCTVQPPWSSEGCDSWLVRGWSCARAPRCSCARALQIFWTWCTMYTIFDHVLQCITCIT